MERNIGRSICDLGYNLGVRIRWAWRGLRARLEDFVLRGYLFAYHDSWISTLFDLMRFWANRNKLTSSRIGGCIPASLQDNFKLTSVIRLWFSWSQSYIRRNWYPVSWCLFLLIAAAMLFLSLHYTCFWDRSYSKNRMSLGWNTTLAGWNGVKILCGRARDPAVSMPGDDVSR